MLIDNLGEKAKTASEILRTVNTMQKNQALLAIKNALLENCDKILVENAKDLEKVTTLSDRLRLTKERIVGIADSIEDIINLPDPIGEVTGGWVRPNGIKIQKVRVPFGVIGVIFESRPNVTVDVSCLCLKAGSAVILRGGKEAINSNKILAEIMRNAIDGILPVDTIQLIEDTSRETSVELMKANKYLDLLIPRGGAGLIQSVVQNATVPVIETGVGNCHLYIDASADFEKAVKIAVNAKCQRPTVCNAIETILWHKDLAPNIPLLFSALEKEGVEISDGDKTEITDWYSEFLDKKIRIKSVESIDEAIKHIEKYSSKHSECIVTENLVSARKFQLEIDSACVYVNASTRFTDGGEFGFGAEIGISTQKLHARGPMGLTELTTCKYLIDGDGQIR